MNGFNSRMEVTEERISELDDRTIKIAQPDQPEQIDWKKELTETCSLFSIRKYLTFMLPEGED